jgi:hypothetical protein
MMRPRYPVPELKSMSVEGHAAFVDVLFISAVSENGRIDGVVRRV